MAHGRVRSIFTAPERGAPMLAHESIAAMAGLGLAGDRYAAFAGTYSGVRVPDPHRAVTLFEQETLDWLLAEHGIALGPHETRRNLLIEGIGLNDLVGRTLQVGEVELRGVDLAHPCAYLESLTHAGVLRALTNRGGLRAEVLTGGVIRVGDTVAVVDA